MKKGTRKFHTKFRPGDLVRDRKTGDEGVIVQAEAVWLEKYNSMINRDCTERKLSGAVYQYGKYDIFPKILDGSLNGAWYKDKQLELVKKGFLH